MIFNEEKTYGMDSIITGLNSYEGKTPRELIDKNGNRDIWKLVKRGVSFDDEVLRLCRITKTVHEKEAFLEIVHREPKKAEKRLKKDNASFEEIVESLSHIEEEDVDKNPDTEEFEEFFDDEDE